VRVRSSTPKHRAAPLYQVGTTRPFLSTLVPGVLFDKELFPDMSLLDKV
jgi:hypothetical protein